MNSVLFLSVKQLQLWSGGLGRSVTSLKRDEVQKAPHFNLFRCFYSQTKTALNQSSALCRLTSQCDQEPPVKRRRPAASEAAALCVAVHGDYAAVGYHGEGIKVFCTNPGGFKSHCLTETICINILMQYTYAK